MTIPEEFWDKSADSYDKTEERFEFIHHRSRELAAMFLKETDIVLDYGCGTGTTACVLLGSVKAIRAIDISSRMIEIAKDKAASNNNTNIDFAQGDIFDDTLPSGSFDAVLAFNMLHTVPDAPKVVQRAIELLKPGGKFISITPCLGGRMSFPMRLQIWLVRALLKLGVIPVPIRQLRPADLDALVADKRLRVLNTEEIFQSVSSYFVVAEKIEGSG